MITAQKWPFSFRKGQPFQNVQLSEMDHKSDVTVYTTLAGQAFLFLRLLAPEP